VDDPSDPAVIEVVDEAMCVYEYGPTNKQTFTEPSELVQTGLKVGKAPGPNGIPNRILRHLPKCAIRFPAGVFNAVLLRQYFPPARKNACVVFIMKPEKSLRCRIPADP
jgi:hypothetical protein